MKIGLITGEFPPMEGGVGAFTQELAQAFHAAGHEVHIISSRKARPEEAKRSFRTRHDPVNLGFAQLHPQIERWRWPSVSTIVDIALRYELEVINIQYQAAAYNMNSPAINLLPWRIKNIIKTFVTFHDLRVPYLFPKAGTLRKKAVLSMAKNSHGIITTNKSDYNEITTNVTTPAVQIPIGSNIKTYSPNHVEVSEVREQLNLADEIRLLAYFGFLNESKGADTLLKGLSQLSDQYHLVFIGGQTGASDSTNIAFMREIKSMINALRLSKRVHWTGFLEDTRVSTYLHAAEILVMPYRDGASLRRGTLMAVLAHGRPLITTFPSEPTPELVDKENVLFIPIDNEDALANAVLSLSNNKELQETLGKNASKTARLFAWEHIAKLTADFYNQQEKPKA